MKETIYLTRDESNIIKGILILLIVLGHNHFLMDGEYVRLQIQLYKFHVIIIGSNMYVIVAMISLP